MPSVGMIRSTRVFVPKSKDFGSNSLENKTQRNRCVQLIEDTDQKEDELCCKNKNLISHDFVQESSEKNDESMMDLDEETESSLNSVNDSVVTDGNIDDKRYGIVYSVKRRKLEGQNFECSSESENGITDRMYGITYYRKRKQRKESDRWVLTSAVNRGEQELERGVSVDETAISFTVESSGGDACWFTGILSSLLRFMRSSTINLSLLAAFMCSEPILGVFALRGIRCLRDPVSKISSGSCKILGTNKFVPMFLVDFLAVPLSFMGLHSGIALGSLYLPQCLTRYLKRLLTQTHGDDHRTSGLSSSLDVSVYRSNLNFVREIGESCGRNGFLLEGRILPSLKRKRNSIRSARTNPLSFDSYTVKLEPDARPFTVKDYYSSFCAPKPKQKRSKLSRNNGHNTQELKALVVELRQNMDSACSVANILVIESDRCFREEGAKVQLDYSSEKEWVLVIKRQGFKRYIYKAYEWMKPGFTNRFTRAMIWAGENDWKLEFPDRRDWVTFKELHRECVERNLQQRVPPPPVACTIHVPKVVEVLDYESSNYVPFVHPDEYITVHLDEVTRLSTRENANYDVDSGDEEWLRKLNNEFTGENVGLGVLSVERFEKMIDILEKAAYYSPNDAFDEIKASSLCPGSDLIFKQVYQYWLRKRKEKGSTLLRVFQVQPLRKPKNRVFNKPVLRRRRSTNRQSQTNRQTHTPRANQQCSLQALNAERKVDDIDMLEEEEEDEDMRRAEEANKKRIEEAKKRARMLTEIAIAKRKRAQILMENADLASYRATLAMRIAEEAQVAKAAEVPTSHFLDEVESIDEKEIMLPD